VLLVSNIFPKHQTVGVFWFLEAAYPSSWTKKIIARSIVSHSFFVFCVSYLNALRHLLWYFPSAAIKSLNPAKRKRIVFSNFESCKILLLTENVEILINLSLLEVSQKMHRFQSTGFTDFLLEYLDVDGAIESEHVTPCSCFGDSTSAFCPSALASKVLICFWWVNSG
jgi:hypothetical protein